MTHAAKRRGESIDSLWMRFEKASKRAGITGDARRHEAAMSKGQKARAKQLKNKRNQGGNK